MQLKAIVSDYATVVHPSSRRRACSTSKRMPKQRHFYRIQVRSFFIEYRNDDGNHIRSAWRDFDGDWAD